MVTLTDTLGDGGFIVSEANGCRSRETVTAVAGSNIVAGMVLGVITASNKYKESDPTAADGSEVATAVAFADTDTTVDADIVVIARDSEVNTSELRFIDPTTAPKAQALAELALQGIIGR